MEVTYQVDSPALKNPPLFADPRWIEPFADTFSYDVEWRLGYREGELAAALPLLVRRRPRTVVARTPKMMTYNPLWLAPTIAHKTVRAMRERREASEALAKDILAAYDSFDLTLGTDDVDMRGFVWHGVAASPLYTIVLPLNRELKLHASKKEALRKAAREDFSLHEEIELDSFFEMQRQTLRRRGAVVGTPTAVQHKLYRKLFDSGLLRQFVVKVGEKIVHARLWLFDEHRRVIHGWQGVSDPEWLPSGVYTWTTMALVERMREEGWRSIDLGGANVASIAQFKAGFGGDLAVYFRIHKPMDSIVKRILGGRR